MRDSKGRFISPRSHLYRMVFDDGHNEDMFAQTPSEAVARRAGGRDSLLPHTISDLTCIDRMRVAVLHRPILDVMRHAATHRGMILLPPPKAPKASRATRYFTDFGEGWDE